MSCLAAPTECADADCREFAHKLAYWRSGQGLAIDPSAMPTRRSTNPPRTPNNSWEKGTARDERGMPYLTSEMQPMGVKEFTQKRRGFEERKRRNHNIPGPEARS